jgi:site-specific DNA-methyltransferase (adenine-specific)
MQRLILRHGDCVDVLKEYADGSIGAVVSDPPYDLTSVSRGGSARKAGTGPFGRHELETTNPRGGFMGKTWDGTGIAFSARLWDEVYRVLRPGGIVKAFSGTRTFHHMAYAMQEAGFVDMSVSCWVYGSGFPKSMNISKQIDKTAGVTRAAQRWSGWGTALKPGWETIIVGRKPE